MGRKKNVERALAMYELYQRGYSLEQVAVTFGVTRQSVYGIFDRHDLARRPKKTLPVIRHGGMSYTMDPDGYCRQTDGDRQYLHHQVWIEAHGTVPDGLDTHHVDGNKAHNEIDNLEALTKSDHRKRHQPFWDVAEKHCAYCGALLIRKRCPGGQLETPAAVARRLYCDTHCQAEHRRGKPRGWTPRKQ